MFDIVIATLAVIAFVDGVRKGFVSEVAGFAALLLGVYGAARFSPLTEAILSPYLGNVPTRLVAFTVTLLIIVMAVHALSGIVTRMLNKMMLSVPNRLLGGLVSAGKIIFIISCGIGIVNRVWPGEDGILSEKEKDEMVTYRFVESFSDFVFPYIDKGMDAVKDIKDEMDSKLSDI